MANDHKDAFALKQKMLIGNNPELNFMPDKMSSETTKHKSDWRRKNEEMDATDLLKNPKILSDDTKFKKQTNLASDLTGKDKLKSAMERANVNKEQFEIEISKLPKHI